MLAAEREGFLSLRLKPGRCALSRPSNPSASQTVGSLLSLLVLDKLGLAAVFFERSSNIF